MKKINFKGSKLYKYLRPFASWRFLVAFGAAWVITNGIWYAFAFAPIPHLPAALVWFSRGYIAVLYGPTPEKLLTIPVAIWIHMKLFKKDEKTREQLEEMHAQAKRDWAALKAKFKRGEKK